MFKNIRRSSIWIQKSSPSSSSTVTTLSKSSIIGISGSSTNLHTNSTTSNIQETTWCLNNVRNLTTSNSVSNINNTQKLKQSNINLNFLNHSRIFKRNMAAKNTSTETGTKEQTDTPTKVSNIVDGPSTSICHKHSNRLVQEKSPYLLQHAHNPVDWYPWSDEAIRRARAERKVIFLSVGYSTCHWCHVMEKESFENEAVAKIMNDNFINIKVDREERPDIDQIYMQFVVLMNGSGGWPMSVWLTPDLSPIMAGTYFPPHERWGTPSFTSILEKVVERWNSNHEQLCSTGNEIIAAIQRSMREISAPFDFEPGSTNAKLEDAVMVFRQRYDSEFGGFGIKPKFPEVSRLNFLFHAYNVTRDIDLLNIALESLRQIGKGGIHDHIFGGFARYAVDRKWHVPHFEKMLYDQGQLMGCFANAYKLTQENKFLRYADGIFQYIMKDLRHPVGGFYSGEDADSLPNAKSSVKIEGAFYAWTWEEVKKAVMDNGDLYDSLEPTDAFNIYTYYYGLLPQGNVAPADDPHRHLVGKNILIIQSTIEETLTNFNINIEQFIHVLDITNNVLHNVREERPRPHLDTKIICSWNGLVLSGLSKLANCGCPKREEYIKAAGELVDFIKDNLYDSNRRLLLRSCYGHGVDNDNIETLGQDQIDGFLVDYAFLIKGLLDYYKASLDGSALIWAKELQDIQNNIFWDSENGAYFYSKENSPNVIVRLKEDYDGAEPCGNSVAARNLILLSHYFDDDDCKQRSEKLLEYFAGVKNFGYLLPEMMSSLLLHEYGLDLVAVVGPDSELTNRFVEICQKFYIPGMIIIHLNPKNPNQAYNQRMQKKFKMINDKPTVYMCHDKVCRMPVTDPDKLEETLRENYLTVTRT